MASPEPADTKNQLQITDLAEVLQLLRRHGYSGTSYYNLGLFLGLSPNTIHVIEADHKGDTESCLRECLTKWLQKADAVQKTKGGPSIYSLVSALRELGENGVADGIDMEKHPACNILDHCSTEQSLVSALPQLILLLHAAKLIKEMIPPTNVQGEALLTEIKEAVCNDYQILEAFAEILRKVPATAEIGNTITKEYREVYYSDDFVKANDADGLKIYLPKNVTSQFQSMRLKMGQTFFKVGSIMMSNPQSPTLDNIKYILGTYDKALRPQVAQCQNIHSILELVYDSCQLDDISLLEFFVDEFNIEEAKPVIKEYKKAIEELKETKLSLCLNETVSYPLPLECEIITIFVNKDVKEFILNDVKRLSSAVFEDLSRHVRLNVVRDDNSFTVTFSFPLILSEQLITAALNNIDVLKENKVKRLTIGYCTVYEVKDTSTATTTEIDEYTSSLSTSSGLMKQLMLSLSVQLINSKEEVTTLIEENIAVKTKAESCKELLDSKSRMLKASLSENEKLKLKTKATETSQLLKEKVSHLTECEEENEKLKEIKEILEEQLVLFQSEKAEFIQERSLLETIEIQKRDEEIQQLKVQLASYQEEKESESFVKKIKKLQTESSTDQDEMRDREGFQAQEVAEKVIKQLSKELKQKDETIQQEQAESKKEIELLQEKITTMNLQLIRKDKQLQTSLKERNPPLIFEDDIYGVIIIDHPLIIEFVQTHQFQRLKDIKMLGYNNQIYQMRANYSRRQHSIGMYFLAEQFVKQLQRRQPELNITESDVLCVQIAALCFNLGHGPFSHIFEMFLDEICIRDKVNKPWRNVSEASVIMFQYMLEDNEDLLASFKRYFDDPMEDIAFIKELIQGIGYEQHKNKRFLYEIVYNKKSGLDVSMIDSIMRDAAVLGKNDTFNWRLHFSKVRVLRCNDGELHTCFSKDDLETYNDLFKVRHSLYRELYYLRKNRIIALMIKRILVKSNEIPIFKDQFRRVTISEATKSMSAYSQLNDSILSVIKIFLDDPEVEVLLKCLDTMRVIGQIGYVTPTHKWNIDRIKQHIVQSIRSCDITDQLIIDPIKNGYEDYESLTQYYYTSDGKTGQWTHEWAVPPLYNVTPLRIFLVSGDRDLIHEVQKVLQKLITDEQLSPGDIYPDEENYNLMPEIKQLLY